LDVTSSKNLGLWVEFFRDMTKHTLILLLQVLINSLIKTICNIHHGLSEYEEQDYPLCLPPDLKEPTPKFVETLYQQTPEVHSMMIH